jgi:hypothetical protein
MKYYSEDETRDLRLAMEEEVPCWPGAGRARMFGVPCFMARGRLFAFLVTRGVVVTRLGQADRDELSRKNNAAPFRSENKVYRKWLRLSVDSPKDLDGVMPFVRKSYEAVLQGL